MQVKPPLWFGLVLLLILSPSHARDEPNFVRGDSDVDTALSLSDVLRILGHLFLSDPPKLDCDDAADANDDGTVNLVDAVALLFYLFEGGEPPPEPFTICGPDPTEDAPTCESFWYCGTGILVNSIGIRLIPIRAGEFMMGSPESERERRADEKLHPVELTCDFYVGETEVTQAQYFEVMGVNPSWFNGRRGVTDYGKVLTRAVETVSWFDARNFCRRLSEREGRRYRLPTEAEWEYCCRAGTTTRFWFGDLLECPIDFDACTTGVCPKAEQFLYVRECGYQSAMPVASRPANPWNLFGVHGLVAEWCYDWYGSYPDSKATNPVGPPAGSTRVNRSGYSVGVGEGLALARCARRFNIPPSTIGPGIGFRVILELPTCPYRVPTE